jgi:hypothetical protein
VSNSRTHAVLQLAKEQRRQPSQAKRRPHRHKAPTMHTRNFPRCARLGALDAVAQDTEVAVRVDHGGVAVARLRQDVALSVPFNPCWLAAVLVSAKL